MISHIQIWRDGSTTGGSIAMNQGSGSKSFVSVTIGRGHRQILMWLSSFNHKCRCLYYVACDSVEDVLAGFNSSGP
jgi:hypothetical protein